MAKLGEDKHGEPEPPNPAEPLKWFGFHLVRDWSKLMKAPLGLVAVIVFSFIAGWLITAQIVVPHKDAEIEDLREHLQTANADNSRVIKENDGLRKDLYGTSTNLTETARAKQAAKVLAQQLFDFVREYTTNRDEYAFRYTYDTIYRVRVDKVQIQLAELGIRSPKLELARTQPLSDVSALAIATELKQMAESK